MTADEVRIKLAELQAIQTLLGTSEAQETYAKVLELLGIVRGVSELSKLFSDYDVEADLIERARAALVDRAADALKLAGVTAHEG